MGAITTPGYLLTVGLLYPESQGTAPYLSGDELVTYRGILLYCSKVGHIVGKGKNILIKKSGCKKIYGFLDTSEHDRSLGVKALSEGDKPQPKPPELHVENGLTIFS